MSTTCSLFCLSVHFLLMHPKNGTSRLLAASRGFSQLKVRWSGLHRSGHGFVPLLLAAWRNLVGVGGTFAIALLDFLLSPRGALSRSARTWDWSREQSHVKHETCSGSARSDSSRRSTRWLAMTSWSGTIWESCRCWAEF